MADYERLITVLTNEVGYREGYSGGHWNNDQKYSDETPGLGWSDYQAWCTTYISWGSFKTNIQIPGCPTASVWAIYQAGLDKNRFTEYPVKGAVVIMGRNTHTGLCIDYDDIYITTVEGNTNTSGSAEGNGVYIRKRLRQDQFITGYVVPYFPDGVYVSPDPVWNNASPTNSNTTVPFTGVKDMHVITAPNRKSALIGPGYVFEIDSDEMLEQLGNLHGRVNGNDRQYDIWRAGAEQGHLSYVPSAPPASPAVDVEALAAALLRKVVSP